MRILGNDGTEYLVGSDSDDTINAGGGEDRVESGGGDDTLDGGLGDDILLGGSGDDTYLHVRGEGVDRIDERGENGVDTIQFVNPFPVTHDFSRVGDDLLISDGSGGGVRLTGHFDPSNATSRVETALLSDGRLVDLTAVIAGGAGSDILSGTGGNDEIHGGDGNDTLDGGGGSDYLAGGNGDDTYVWGTGYGNESLREAPGSGGEDTIELRGDLTPDDVRLNRQDRDLVITLKSGESLRVEDHFSFQSFSSAVAVETLKFSDGTTLDLGRAALDGRGSAGEIRLVGQDAGEVIRGGSGSDTITGNGGADALLGGAGDDRYQWNAGDGFDVINEQGAGGVDTLSLISGGRLDLDDVGFSRTGNDLRIHVGDETITVRNQYADGPGNRVEILEYGDGHSENLDLANVKAGTSASDALNGTFDAESLFGSSGNDIIDAGAGDDFVRGDSGNDTIFGGTGDNTLIGGTGNDEIHGGADRDAYFWKPGDGDDVIFETRGNDFDFIRLDSSIPFEDISYVRSGDDLTIKIATGGSLRIVGQYEDGDDSPLIESLVYGSTRTLSLDNILNSGVGDETISGGSGIDTFPATPGDDLLLGGAGDDVYYFGRGSGHDVIDDIGGRNDVHIGPGISIADLDFTAVGDDLVISIAGNSSDSLTIKENYGDNLGTGFEYFIDGQWLRAGRSRSVDRNNDDTIGGSSGDNTILPAHEANLLAGVGGDDLLYGGGGDDQLQGGDGDDTLVGGPGDDYLIGQTGNDVYRWNLGDGSDEIDLRFGSGGNEDAIQFGPGLSFSNVTLGISGDDLVLTIAGQETIRVFDHFDPDEPSLREIRFDDGTVFPVERLEIVLPDDGAFEGSADSEIIVSTSSDDTLSGGGGNDTLNGGPGSDTLDGGAGTDVYQIGGFTGDDIIVTQGPSGGRDVIEVRPSNITVEDLALRMNGDDLIITLPNGGTTTIQNFGPENRVGQINLSDGTRIALDGGIATGQFSGPTSNPDNTANAVRSTFFGTDEDDSSLSGSVYGEVLDGRDGDDTILAGGGDDTLVGGAGNDRLDGEGGNDRYVFSDGHGDDVVADREGDNTLVMADGVMASQLTYTRLGQDLVVSVAESEDSITLEDFFSEGGARVRYIEFSDGDRLELDTLTFEENGTEAADTLSPVHPNMVVRGGGGNDTIQANLFFSRFDSTNLFDGGAGDDTLIGVNGLDHLIGGAGDDSLDGGTEDDTLEGGAGDDTLTGSGGDDLLVGGSGDDTYIYTSGSHTIVEDTDGGRDVIEFTSSFYTQDNLILERIGDDLAIHVPTFFSLSRPSTPLLTIQNHFATSGGLRVEEIRFADDSTFNLSSVQVDWFGGTDLDDIVVGSAGDDILFGQSGNDHLDAGAGDDSLIGGAGTDRLEGGAGSDTYQWDSGHGSDIIFDAGGSADVIQLNDTSSGSAVFFRDGDDLIIEDRGRSLGAHLRVEDHFAVGGANQVEQLIYENGDTVDLTSLSIAASLTLTGTDRNDVLEGGAGDDVLRGGADGDTYVWGPNSGNDRIEETDASGFGDTIRLSSNLTRDDVSFGRIGNDLTLTLVTGEVLTVVDHFAAGNASRIERLPFIGTAEVLLDVDGTMDGDNLIGTAANETLRARDGADILDGGDGVDVLQGGAGDDVYRGTGIWQDTIDEQGAGGEDRIELAEGISQADVSFRRFGDDLRIDIGQETPITILNHYEASGASRIETLRFSDGSEMSLITPPLETSSFSETRGTNSADRLVGGDGVDRLIGEDGDDTLIGNDGSDSLVGGEGNDVLIGGGGSDQYFVGGGNDTIDEQGGGGTDRLILGGEVRSSDLMLERSGDDLIINVADGRSVTVLGHFDAGGNSALESVTVGSGTGTRSLSISDFSITADSNRTAEASSTSEPFSSSPSTVNAELGAFDVYSGS